MTTAEITSNHFLKANPEKLGAVSRELADLILSNTARSKSHLAWKIGKRLREALTRGELAGNVGLVWQLLQCEIEVQTGKKLPAAELAEFTGIYDLFPEAYEQLGKLSHGAVKVIARSLRHDPARALDCLANRYFEQQVKRLLGW